MLKKFKVLQIDHIAFATSSINNTKNIFTEILGLKSSKIENVENEKVKVLKLFPKDNQSKIELLEPISKDSTIKKFLNKNGNSLHHIALEVDNIKAAIKYLTYKKIDLIYNKPQIGGNNKLITFIHPKSTPGLLLELCQSK